MSNNYQFANRCDWEMTTNKITSLSQQLKNDDPDLIDLTESNPTKCGFAYPHKEIIAAFNNERNMQYVPDAQGLSSAREAIKEVLNQNGPTIDVTNMFLTSSTSEAYNYVFRLLANPGDKILFPAPSYPLFHFLGELNDIQIQYYPLTYHEQWSINMAELIELLDEHVKAIVLVNPNNPTGSYVARQELDHLNKICRTRNIALISDEVFFEFSHKQLDHTSLMTNSDTLTFVLGGLSKMLGMPQMKLSWILLNGPQIQVEEARQKLEIIADTYLSVNTPAMNALNEWLLVKDNIQNQIKMRIVNNLDFLTKHAAHLKGSRVLNTQGGWYAVLSLITTRSEEEWVLKLLNKYRVFVHPGYFYDFSEGAHLVISLLPPKEKFEEGVLRMLSRIEQEQG